MNRAVYRWLYAGALLASVTGIVYGWLRYAVKPDDPYAVVNHPLQPHLLHAHVVTVPLLVLMLGVFWRDHAARYWQERLREGRRSGLVAWASVVPMIVSGYAIQVSVSATARSLWIGVHLAASTAWMGAMVTHAVIHWRSRRSRPPGGVGR